MLIDSFLWKGFGTNRCKSNLKFYVNQLLCYVSIVFIFSNLHKKKKKKRLERRDIGIVQLGVTPRLTHCTRNDIFHSI